MSNKTEKKKAMVPKLRFPEFRDARPWEVKRLGEVCEIAMGASPKSSAYNDQKIGLPLLQGNADVKERLSSPRIFTSEITKECFPGDILLGVRAPVGTVATSIHHACIGRGIAAFRSTKNNSQEFLYQLLLLYESNWSNISQGGTFDSVNSNDIKKLKVAFPSLPEQQKIADCLSSLDEVIKLEAKKLEALKAHKRSLMQQLFPREGETTPRLRFPEFRDAGPWEVKRLGEVFQERNERNGSGLELLSVTLFDGVVKASQLDRKNNASSDLSNYKKVYPNDIVYNSMRMWQGASGVSKWHGIVSPAYTVVELLENHNPQFWAYYFKLSESIEKFARYSQGVTSDTWNLKFPAFSLIRMAFPSLPEQQKIADCLSSLDEVIELQTKKIEGLKAHKNGLMQQLFPQEVG